MDSCYRLPNATLEARDGEYLHLVIWFSGLQDNQILPFKMEAVYKTYSLPPPAWGCGFLVGVDACKNLAKWRESYTHRKGGDRFSSLHRKIRGTDGQSDNAEPGGYGVFVWVRSPVLDLSGSKPSLKGNLENVA